MQIASFPQIKRLEEFDFSYQPKLNAKLIREVAGLEFLRSAINIIFYGAQGVGKTYLAISIDIKAASLIKRILFNTTEKLTEEVAAGSYPDNLIRNLILSRVIC